VFQLRLRIETLEIDQDRRLYTSQKTGDKRSKAFKTLQTKQIPAQAAGQVIALLIVKGPNMEAMMPEAIVSGLERLGLEFSVDASRLSGVVEP